MKLSLLLPVLNEAEALPLLLPALAPVLASIEDDTPDLLSRSAAANPRIQVLSFSRNFGHQAAITAGFDFSTGDAMIVMDADVQDPTDLLPETVRLYRVFPPRVSRSSNTWFKRKTAGLFYLLMRTMVGRRIPAEVNGFRLLSRNGVMALRQFREKHRFLRGMIAWLGLREALLPFERRARVAGQTKFGVMKILRFSWTAVCSSSALPLRLSMWLGPGTSAVGMGYLCWAVYTDLVRSRAVWGWTSIVFLQFLFFGVTLVCIGLNRAVNFDEAPGNAARALFLAPRAVESGIHANRV